MRDLRHWENGGYFVFRQEIFDELEEDEDLVEDALVRLVRRGRVIAYPYKGYWSPADTVKERIQLDERYQHADCPWMIWDPERSGLPARSFVDSADRMGAQSASSASLPAEG
jgi:glucose-1-phosphate cytidylyltransferase